MPDRLYEETDWLATIIITCAAAGFAIAAAIARQLPLLFPAGLMVLMAISFYCRTRVTIDELTVRFGIWRIPALRLSRIEVQSAQAYARKWDGVNFQVRRIRDIAAQGGGSERGVLIRSARGDFWVQSRRADAFLQALATGWGLPISR